MERRIRESKTAVVVAGALGAGCLAWADPPFTQTPDPQPILWGCDFQWPWQTIGKECTTQPNNVNYAHASAPGQILAWDGIGGVKDSTLVRTVLPGGTVMYQLDALANHGDALYREVIADAATLLVSVTGDKPPGAYQGGGQGGWPATVNREHIWYETPNGNCTPRGGVWARTDDINHNLRDDPSYGQFRKRGICNWNVAL